MISRVANERVTRQCQHCRVRRHSQAAVEHNTQRLHTARIDIVITNIERRVVGQHGSDPGHDGPGPRAQLLHVIALLAREAHVHRVSLQTLDRLRDVDTADRGTDDLVDVIDVESQPGRVQAFRRDLDVAAGRDPRFLMPDAVCAAIRDNGCYN